MCTIDWNLCALRQESSNKAPPICPARAAKGDGAGCIYVAHNLKPCQHLDDSPIPVLSKLDERSGFEQTFRMHEASWRKSCRTYVSVTVLNRNRKSLDYHSNPIKTRKLTDDSISDK